MPKGRTIRTPKNRAAFLEALRETRCVTDACAASDMSRSAAYHWRKEDESFRSDWDEAWQAVVDELEASTMTKAIEGWEEPVFHEGVVCGHKRRFSPTLMIFMLKANRPEKYHLEKKEAKQLGESAGGVIVAPGHRSPRDWIDKEKGQMGEGGKAEAAGEVREVTQFAEAGLVLSEPIRVQIVEEEGETVAKPPEPIESCCGFGETPEAAIEDAGWHIAAMRESLITSVEAGRPLGKLMQERHEWFNRIVSVRG